MIPRIFSLSLFSASIIASVIASGICQAAESGATCDAPVIPCGPDGTACSPEVRAYDLSIVQTSVFRKDAVAPLTPLAYPIQAVNFTTYTGWADGKTDQTISLGRDTWITVEPELQTLCRRITNPDLIPGLHKLLGLKPATASDAGRKFVLFTIAKEEPTGPTGKGAFRPCADPDPTATQCDNQVKGPDAYVQWFSNTMVASYKLDANMNDTGYPWTRLGYTYNWDPAATSHRGAQEYVVPAGTPVQIRAIVSPEEYCRTP